MAFQPLQQALAHLDKAFTRFFGEKKGYPRFHSKRDKQSAAYPQGVKVQWENGVPYLPKSGSTRTDVSRQCVGIIKTVTASRVPSGLFFVSVLVEGENQVLNPGPEALDRAIGGDPGLHDFLVLWTGDRGEDIKS